MIKKKESPEEIKMLEKRYETSAVIPIVCGTWEFTDITIEDFLMLDIGDVIELNQKLMNHLLIKSGEIPKFTGQPGK